jgi:hypothetical protein
MTETPTHDAIQTQGREELRAQHAAMLEMQDPLARTLLAVRDALQSLPEDALGEGESGGACWPLRDELLTGVEHCLKLQRELKERSDTLAILSLPPQSLPVEVSVKAKALVWRRTPLNQRADTPLGIFFKRETPQGWIWEFKSNLAEFSDYYSEVNTEQEADAAMQAHYDACVSQLVEGCDGFV